MDPVMPYPAARHWLASAYGAITGDGAFHET
jgi:hypothetical protein